MRILYDHQVFNWQRYGGISRYFYELITRMTAEPDVDISLFLGMHVNRYGLERYRGSFVDFWGIRRPAIPRTNKLFSGVNRLLFPRFLRRSRPDIYHATYYAPQGGQFDGARIITVYDMIHERFPSAFPWYDRTARNKRSSMDRADGIICISESTKRDVMELVGIPGDRITVTYLGSSLNAAVTDPPLIEGSYILYVGQRAGYKNFERLAQAVARSEQVRRNFRIICFGGGPFTKGERERALSIGIGHIVQHITGTDAVLANLYKYAAVYVCPSLYEGFGIPTLEAMQMGCPVLVSRTSSLPEIAGPAGCYFDPTDSDDLSGKLEKIVLDEGVRGRLTALGLAQAQLFSWDRCARETLDFYRSRLARDAG
jgi:glycosyltransferase involved in cell wall biosynthesis